MLFDTTAQVTLFSLILMRMSGFILLNPILGRRNIPMQVKAICGRLCDWLCDGVIFLCDHVCRLCDGFPDGTIDVDGI